MKYSFNIPLGSSIRSVDWWEKEKKIIDILKNLIFFLRNSKLTLDLEEIGEMRLGVRVPRLGWDCKI